MLLLLAALGAQRNCLHWWIAGQILKITTTGKVTALHTIASDGSEDANMNT
jgi:hypothetical protein